MQWEQLTATDFAAVVGETGTCVIVMGVLEKHSEHLPPGTDFLMWEGKPTLSIYRRGSPALIRRISGGRSWKRRCTVMPVSARRACR